MGVKIVWFPASLSSLWTTLWLKHVKTMKINWSNMADFNQILLNLAVPCGIWRENTKNMAIVFWFSADRIPIPQCISFESWFRSNLAALCVIWRGKHEKHGIYTRPIQKKIDQKVLKKSPKSEIDFWWLLLRHFWALVGCALLFFKKKSRFR